MKLLKIILLLACWCFVSQVIAQKSFEIDTLHVQPYLQKIKIMGFVSTRFIYVDDGKNFYSPNSPLATGVGFAIRNTIFGGQVRYGFIPLKDQTVFGKSKMLDLQLHNYGRKVIVDGFYQNYKGFYSERQVGKVDEILPDMSVLQIGGEATYLFEGDRLSSKAAFGLSEIQLRSAGSILLGAGTYYYQVEGMRRDSVVQRDFENIQLGINTGYAYSWVIDKNWLLSSMVKGGANFGNVPKNFKKGKLQIYPTAFARFAGNYHKKDWGISFVVIIGNKSVYPAESYKLNLTDLSMQLSYVKHVDYLFKSKLRKRSDNE